MAIDDTLKDGDIRFFNQDDPEEIRKILLTMKADSRKAFFTDIDGFLTTLIYELMKYENELHGNTGIKLTMDQIVVDSVEKLTYFRVLGMSENQASREVITCFKEIYSSGKLARLPPFDDALETLALIQRTNPVNVGTARGGYILIDGEKLYFYGNEENAQQATIDWLHVHNKYKPTAIYFNGSKLGILEKAYFIEGKDADDTKEKTIANIIRNAGAFGEDNLYNAAALCPVIPVLLKTQPWNTFSVTNQQHISEEEYTKKVELMQSLLQYKHQGKLARFSNFKQIYDIWKSIKC